MTHKPDNLRHLLEQADARYRKVAVLARIQTAEAEVLHDKYPRPTYDDRHAGRMRANNLVELASANLIKAHKAFVAEARKAAGTGAQVERVLPAGWRVTTASGRVVEIGLPRMPPTEFERACAMAKDQIETWPEEVRKALLK